MVGLGPVGAVLSALLGQYGIDVIVIEPDVEPVPFPRAIAADDEMLRTLLQLPGLNLTGLADPVELFQRGRVEIRDAARRLITSVDFGETQLGVSGLSFFHQPTLERALRVAAEAAPSVQVRYGRRVIELSDEQAGIRLGLDDGSAIAAQWVVGCDGATSTVRRLRQIPYTGRTFSERWLVVDLDTPAPLAHLPCFTYVLDRRRPTVNMPRPGGHRFEFMLMPGDDAQALGSAASVQRLLEPYLAPLTPAERDGLQIVRATGYTYHSRHARRWRDGRVLLAGDAAHCMPPFGGQGLGAGIGDALALAWRLHEAVRGISSPRVLDGYEAERRPRVARMNRSALMVGRLLIARSRPGSAAVTAGLGLIDAAPWLGTKFRAGALRAGPRAPLPNPRVRTRQGDVVRLDDVVGAGWALLAREQDPSTLISAATHARLRARSATLLAVFPVNSFAPGDSPAQEPACVAVEDLDGWLLARCEPGRAVLVRPNRFIEAAGDHREIDSALTRLLHI